MNFKFLIVLVFLMTFSFGFCQTESENKDRSIRVFNLTKISFSLLNRAYTDTFIEGKGTFLKDYENGVQWSFNNITGFFVTKRLSTGIGFGLDGYHKPNINTFPIYVDLRYYLTPEADRLNVYMNLGPTVDFFGENSTFKKGTLLNLGLATKLNLNESITLMADIFYTHKTVSLTSDKLRDTKQRAVLDGTGIGIGIIF